MKRFIADILTCPRCLPDEENLRLTVFAKKKEDILNGELVCEKCGAIYPIHDGVANLIPGKAKTLQTDKRYESFPLISAYLWSHFGDLFQDPNVSDAYTRWASWVPEVSGMSIDAGCAPGRFTWELSLKSDFAVGFDYSESFVTIARKLLVNRELQFELVEEGNILSRREITLPPEWDSGRVEFIVADAHCPPFRSDTFSIVSSLNLVDKLERPLEHLEQMSRIARKRNSHFFFSDPFSWSHEVSPEKHWLGGKIHGVYSGRGLKNVRSILEGSGGKILPPWSVEEKGSVWWKLRNHCNHFELIRSWYLKATR